MKTAISIPDPLFKAGEQFAKRLGLSRSELYAVALQEYLRSHQEDHVTDKLNAVYDDEDSSLDPFFVELQAQTLSEEAC
ncbi:MAG: CopG family ribbon-helix-helix protein [Nostochopsis sp.]